MPVTQRAPEETLKAVLAEVRARGYRMTPQRQLILETVYRSRGHLTAEAILKAVRKRFAGVNITTVYRNLEMLEEIGYVCHAHLGHTPNMYHPTERREHQHLVCRRCGAVEEIGVKPLIPMSKAVLNETGFEVDLTHFALLGTCRHCRESGAG
jgi:Fur family ferric uptake transcriptional regulator